MPGTNAAQRVANYLARIHLNTPNTPMVDALGVFFDYQPKDPYREHARKLELLLSQIDLSVDGLRRAGFPEHLYMRQIESARSAFTASALNHQWNHVTGQVASDVKLAFDWMAYALPDQNDVVEKEALAELLEALDAIASDELLQTLPAVWREVIERHINAILDALAGQSITGSAPVEKAVKDLMTDVVLQSEELGDAPVQNETKAFVRKAFGVVKATIEVAVKSEKALTAIDKLYQLVSERGPALLEWINK